MNNKGKLLKVQIRGGFSDRNNIDPINKTIQYKDFDERTRTSFYNMIGALYRAVFKQDSGFERREDFWDSLFSNAYSLQVDYISPNRMYDEDAAFKIIDNTINNDSYDAVLSLIEYICRLFNRPFEYHNPESLTVFQIFNKVFEREYVGYRFIHDQITPITDSTEISEIEEAALINENEVDQHIEKALTFLSNREKPDYENSIKESISAVEAMCGHLIGEKATLGDALKKLTDNGIYIHPSLQKAFLKLYGYTSDASGIRHSGEIDGPNATFEEAKYMVVSCSAFVNYLRGLESKKA